MSTEPRLSDAGVDKPIIFFDGVCGMCNASVQAILKLDGRGRFYFAPLQGETARRLLPPLKDDPKDWSILYLDEQGLHEASDATVRILRRLGGVWWLLSLARVIPRGLRDCAYRVIARNRYRLFGKKEVCSVPTLETRARFLP